MLLRIIALPIVFCASLNAQSVGLPEPSTLDGLGVNIHFTNPKGNQMKLLPEAGFRWVRMDFAWSGIERKKGEYFFEDYDRLMTALGEYHIRPIFILDYSNPMYDNNQSPHTSEGRAAFAKWAAASAMHFKGRGIIWEMYNEPNIKFWRPNPNVEDYARLAMEVGRALHDAAPEEIYIGPATSQIDMKFLEACFKAGCLRYWSAVSVHPYRQKAPETVVAEYQKLRTLIDKYSPARKKIPIISGEWGYSSVWRNFDEKKQGEYLPREMLTNMMSGIPISIWYDWHDDGVNPTNAEHHFGTVHVGYEPKPAYKAMKALSSALAGSNFSRRMPLDKDADWVLLFRGPHGVTFVAWTTGQDHEIDIPYGEGKFRVTDYLGQPQGELTAGPKGITVRLTGGPKYISAPTPQ